ncbi:MAG: hypothetical protein EOP48_06665, partial [Sphingobacteriales bacterium]
MKTQLPNQQNAENFKEASVHSFSANNGLKIIKPAEVVISKTNVLAYRLFFVALILGLLMNIGYAFAQDPLLPPTNLGLSNVYDGFAGKPGWAFQGYVQAFNTKRFRDGSGKRIASDLKVNSVASLNQLIYLTPVKLLGGNLGFTVIIPIVQINSSNLSGPAPTVNPVVLGDIVQGTAVQWSDKKLFEKAFSHRIEFDVTFPTGAYDSRYNVNASSHLYTLGIYHALTIFLNNKISISTRNQFNYNTHIIGQSDKPGAYYNGNYSIDYALTRGLKIEAVGYFLTQLNQDSHAGNTQYYADQYGIGNTRERVLGIGPGLAYF